jgi:hypothetical protein
MKKKAEIIHKEEKLYYQAQKPDTFFRTTDQVSANRAHT